MSCSECDETREHRHELGMRVFTPVKPAFAPEDRNRRGLRKSNRGLAREHMEHLLQMIDPEGKRGITREELGSAYYSYTGADAVVRLNELLAERCPDRPRLRFPDLPSHAGRIEVRELAQELGFVLKRGSPDQVYRHKTQGRTRKALKPRRRAWER